MDKELIRNFSIIAHIDHGKSTLADRLIELTGAVDKRHFREQFLDSMDLERERGITIKASTIQLRYPALDGREYVLNLIDTPGHVDFTYEVIKSITCCEGAILLVDASQGIEAQTVANFYLAREHKLKVIPVINKIDMTNADIERVRSQMVNILKFKEEEIIFASAKEGRGTQEILERIVKVIPPPAGDDNNPLQALIFDSSFDTFKGVILYVRVVNGKINREMPILMMQAKGKYKIEELGIMQAKGSISLDFLSSGEVGFLSANIRSPEEIIIGDTITSSDSPAPRPLVAQPSLKPLVFCGIYPVNPKDFSGLRGAMEKLHLTDASFVYEPETSVSLGSGFRCGFLGLLHMEVVQERLEREYDLNLILSSPSVVYRVRMKKGEWLDVDNPAKLPAPHQISQIEEPYINANILIPISDMERVIELSKQRRGEFISSEYLGDRLKVIFQMPLSEVIVDFYDRIKSVTHGYGSLDYEFIGFRKSEIVKMDILINGRLCEAFSSLVYKEKAYSKGRMIVEKLRDLIPRQLFQIVIQAEVGHHVMVSEKIRPLSKHVTGKCYGGDITRKRKLWEKQKMGKKRLKRFGQVEIPQEAFLAVLKV